jgi:ORF6N domain
MKKKKRKISIVAKPVEQSIMLLRGQKVILDTHLAALYAVTVKRLNQQVRRNINRFPDDFFFQLSEDEHQVLRLQNATSNEGRGGRRFAPFAFTEHGAIMAATVLNSQRAVEMSVFVVRAFVRLREVLATHRELAVKLAQLEHRLDSHDRAVAQLFEAIKKLMQPVVPVRRRIGFEPKESKPKALKAAAR